MNNQIIDTPHITVNGGLVTATAGNYSLTIDVSAIRKQIADSKRSLLSRRTALANELAQIDETLQELGAIPGPVKLEPEVSAKPEGIKKTRKPRASKGVHAPSEDIETVIAAIEQHDAGRTSEELQGQLGWEKGRVSKAIKAAGEQIRVEGRARGARYFSQKSDDAS